MWQGKEELLFDLLTRDAILVWRGEVYRLDGPFESYAHALEAADELRSRMGDIRALAAA